MTVNCSDNIYVIKYTDPAKGTITVTKSSLVTNLLDITLVGKTRREYGEVFNENILHLLEGFACPENLSTPGIPDYTIAFGELLQRPSIGQRWYNSTQKRTTIYNGSVFVPLSLDSDVAGVSGVIASGHYLPLPVGVDGRIFTYQECSWCVSPFSFIDGSTYGEIEYMNCTTTSGGLVTAQYRFVGESSLRNGLANYMIIGLKGNNNLGALGVTPYPVPSATPGISPTPTPTHTVTPSVTPPVTPTVTPTVSVTATISPTPSVTPTIGGSPTPTATRTPTPTPTTTLTPTPTKTPTPTPTVTPSPTPSPGPLLASISYVSGCTPSGGCCDAGIIQTGTPVSVNLAALVSGQGASTLDYTWTYLSSSTDGPTATISTGASTSTAVLSSPFSPTDTTSSFGQANFSLLVHASDGRSVTVNFCLSGTTRGGAFVGGGGGPPGGCVTLESMIYGLGAAINVVEGDMIPVVSSPTLEVSSALVTVARTELQPCVRLTTSTGIVLECSTTAPISDVNGNQILAPNLLGVIVPVYDNGMFASDEIISVEDIGEMEVRYITCDNNYFLAGKDAGRYLLHHNAKQLF